MRYGVSPILGAGYFSKLSNARNSKTLTDVSENQPLALSDTAGPETPAIPGHWVC